MIHSRKDYNRIQDPENKIKKDEPVFLIRAQDRLAITILEIYASVANLTGCSYEMIDSINEHIELMEKWQEKNTTKIPDLPKDK